MSCTFEQYLINVGVRSNEYLYTREELSENVEYFRRCYSRDLSAYKALLFLADDGYYIRKKKLKRILNK